MSRGKNNKKKHSFLNFLNSGFAITVIGGLILWGVSAFWQYQMDVQKQLESKKNAHFNRQNEAIKEFSSSFIYTLTLLQQYKIREVWLIETINKKESAKFRDGRTYRETLIEYEKNLEKYSKQPSSHSIKAKVKASFSQCSVQPYLNEIFSGLETIISAPPTETDETLAKLIPNIEENFEVLLQNMINESVGKHRKCEKLEQN